MCDVEVRNTFLDVTDDADSYLPSLKRSQSETSMPTFFKSAWMIGCRVDDVSWRFRSVGASDRTTSNAQSTESNQTSASSLETTTPSASASWNVVVRNTFLHVTEDADYYFPPSKRSSSEPRVPSFIRSSWMIGCRRNNASWRFPPVDVSKRATSKAQSAESSHTSAGSLGTTLQSAPASDDAFASRQVAEDSPSSLPSVLVSVSPTIRENEDSGSGSSSTSDLEEWARLYVHGGRIYL